MIELDKKIYVSGHNGMVGSAIVRFLKESGYKNIITASREELELTNQSEVNNFFKLNEIDVVFNAAAKVGGIVCNASHPGDFIHQNLMIQTNLLDASIRSKIDRFIFLGSCCIYPKFCDQPMKEEYLLTGDLEPTDEPYAVGKIAGIISCQALYQQYGLKSVCPMPINLFGKGDNLHPENSHVIAGLMRRLHFAKINEEETTIVWGSGKVKREYMHIDDCAEGIVFVSDKFDNGEIINIAPGTELTTRETAEIIADVVGYKGKLVQDTTKPDGTMRKLACSEKIKSLGWEPKLDFYEALTVTYEDFKEEILSGRWD
jgi:GDP-L-fucose synthase